MSKNMVWFLLLTPEPLPAPSLNAALCNSISFSSAAAVDSSQSSPLASLSIQQWVISSAESEKGEQERVVHSGFKAPSLDPPLLFFLTVSPRSTWPVSTLNPRRSTWVFGYSHTCHFAAAFWSWMSNFGSSDCCMSLRLAWKSFALHLLWLY